MSISICIPTYNRLSHLKKLIESITAGFGDYSYEIIVADGGSNDGTVEYLRSIDKVILIEQKELSGAVKAFNVCFRVAKNKYIYWPPDDFVVIPKILIKCCKLMDEHEEIAIVAPKIREPIFGDMHGVELFGNYLVLSKMHIFRASALKKVGYFDENFRTYAIDDDSCLMLLNEGYTMIFSREIGAVHNRIKDELWKRNNNIMENKSQNWEKNYLKEKWMVLNIKIGKNLNLPIFKKFKLFFFRQLCKGIFKLKLARFISSPSRKFLLNLYDKFLEQCVVFKVKEYNNLKDFYLAQRLPKEILNK